MSLGFSVRHNLPINKGLNFQHLMLLLKFLRSEWAYKYNGKYILCKGEHVSRCMSLCVVVSLHVVMRNYLVLCMCEKKMCMSVSLYVRV